MFLFSLRRFRAALVSGLTFGVGLACLGGTARADEPWVESGSLLTAEAAADAVSDSGIIPVSGLAMESQSLIANSAYLQTPPPPAPPVTGTPTPVEGGGATEILPGPGQLESTPGGSLSAGSISGDPQITPQTATSITPSPRPAPAAKPGPPFKPLFFDNNFKPFVNSDDLYVFGEELKELEAGPLTFSAGGQIRHRYMDEANRLRPGGPGSVTYDLWRWRQYVNAEYDGLFRLYVEGIDAQQFGEGIGLGGVPRQTAIDINRMDVQNAFVDLILLDGDTDLTLRYGRQELLYGAQRLISPLDWANTRRNFEGFKAMFGQGDLKVDAFATRPVNHAAGNPGFPRFASDMDHPDFERTFSGVYATLKANDTTSVDAYWLWLREEMPDAARVDGSRHTIGGRIYGTQKADGLLIKYDFEGALQVGHDTFARPGGGLDPVGSDVVAGMAVAQLDFVLADVAWKPTLRTIAWWTSGDNAPGDGENNTFNQLFPLGHAYWGIIDNLSGQNLTNYSVQGIVSPTEKLSLVSAYHWFFRSDGSDVVYNVAGAPIPGDLSQRDIGQELDLIATYKYNANFNIQLGAAWFWYGDYITQGPAVRPDADFYYVQTTFQY